MSACSGFALYELTAASPAAVYVKSAGTCTDVTAGVATTTVFFTGVEVRATEFVKVAEEVAD
jgi:hypothetical protein